MEYVKLTPIDLELLIDCCELVVEFKSATLSKQSWSIFERDYLPPLVEHLKNNQFKIATTQDNVCLWLIDQICHSRRLLKGVKAKDCLPLADTDLGSRVLEILRAASRGQTAYNSFKHNQRFAKLFV